MGVLRYFEELPIVLKHSFVALFGRRDRGIAIPLIRSFISSIMSH